MRPSITIRTNIDTIKLIQKFDLNIIIFNTPIQIPMLLDSTDAQKSYQSFSTLFPTTTQLISLSGSFHVENTEKFQE